METLVLNSEKKDFIEFAWRQIAKEVKSKKISSFKAVDYVHEQMERLARSFVFCERKNISFLEGGATEKILIANEIVKRIS